MSAELSFTDEELAMIRRALRDVISTARLDPDAWESLAEAKAAETALAKVGTGLNRPSMRRRR